MRTSSEGRAGVVERIAVSLIAISTLTAAVYSAHRAAAPSDLPDRLPEAAPYVLSEARVFPPPYEPHWKSESNPAQCQSCHAKIFEQWNGSMMSNAWRDPAWRAAFLLMARSTSANGECDTPDPPDGTEKAKLNPYAVPGKCASRFETGTGTYTLSRPGSVLDHFCSRCHMPTNFLDNVPFASAEVDPATGEERAVPDPRFHPTSDEGTGLAFATLERQFRNTASGKAGVFCAVCHTLAETRDTPFHNYVRGGEAYAPAVGHAPREALVGDRRDQLEVPDPDRRNLGYAVGAGSFRLSPHAIALGERFGPLTGRDLGGRIDRHTSEVFGVDIPYQHADAGGHPAFHSALLVRSEACAACHDVTNALPIRNPLGKWVGGFPIERTYTEWVNSRYADRPGNRSYDPAFKRECQSCHMQQDYGQPGTARTLYRDGRPLPPPTARVADEGGAPRPFFTHHFVGGNAYVPRLVGKALQDGGVAKYPELSAFSFSSADHRSPYSRALWTDVGDRGPDAQHARLAWDRLRNALALELSAPRTARPGGPVPISIRIVNEGCGHDFPTGFPEGRVAWVAVHAWDLATGAELPLRDSVWKRTAAGVGNLTRAEMVDPNYPGCDWKIPGGSVDPYAVQFKAVATLGNGCPTLELTNAQPLNLVTGAGGQPVDADGRPIDGGNPGVPRFLDRDGDGDLFDDAFLRDTRLRPLPHAGATATVDRYAVVVPPGTRGPIAVSAAVYYQSLEGEVALKFLGNLADTNGNFALEPCVLGGACDGRKPETEPAVVEGSPPVPMVVRSAVVEVEGAPARAEPPRAATYPRPPASAVPRDVVPKVSFSEPVTGVDARTFTLRDEAGNEVPALVDQIGDGTFGLFPGKVFLEPSRRYVATVRAGVCGVGGRCLGRDLVWSFTTAAEGKRGRGDTSVPAGFRVGPGAAP
jgi:hypothetical protein